MRGLKLKISAAAVTVNAMMALAMMGSTPAHAQSCSGGYGGCATGTMCNNGTALALCQASAPAGCTAVAVQCGELCLPYQTPQGWWFYTTCYYQ